MKLGVIGSGAWGTALAIAGRRAGSEVVIWSRSSDVAEDINNNHLNSKYLGQIKIDKNITASTEISDVSGCDAILLVVPAQELRNVLSSLRGVLGSLPLEGGGSGGGWLPPLPIFDSRKKTLTSFSRDLRNNPTDAENKFWQIVRNKQVAGFRFRRQHELGNQYIADFICLKQKLIIELDGGQHINQAQYDNKRTKFLEKEGYRVFRVWNGDILNNSTGVMEAVLYLLNNPQEKPDIFYSNGLSNLMLSTPSLTLPPQGGGNAAPDFPPLVICAKGVEHDSFALMSEIVSEYFPKNPVAILSGPNFADEVAKGLPACATLACADKDAAAKIITILGSPLFRLYYSDDVIGAQIGGAIKNVIAIACGIAIGKGLGENARAALVTRGLAEIGRLCVKMGGKQETLLGLCGIGDIMLTCGSEKSRNMHFGMELGKGIKLEKILAEGKTVEGVVTSKSVSMLAEKLGVDMPISNAIQDILYENAGIEAAIKSLLDRPFTSEV